MAKKRIPIQGTLVRQDLTVSMEDFQLSIGPLDAVEEVEQ